jgi:transposase
MSNASLINPEDRTNFETLARTTKDKKTADRIRIILALDDGHSAREVAKLFLVDESTVKKWRNKFRKRKLFTDWLSTEATGYSGKLTKEQETEISSFVETETVTDCKEIVSFIKEQYGISYTVNGVTKLLHRLGFVYKQTTLVPGKLDEAAQAAWLKGYEKLKAKLPENEVILFGDGVHPSHNVHATKAWIKKGEQKRVPTNTGRKRLNINGVLNIENMEAVVHYANTLNAQTTMELFEKVQAAYPDKKKIHLIVDNARYYKNKELQTYLRKRKCRIKICWLPPYSPNLNFIERLWHFLKKYIIGIKRRDSFKEFETDIRQFFDNFKDYEQQLRQFIGTKLRLIQTD